MKITKHLLEITWISSPHGHSNGYIGVSQDHPWYLVDYNILNREVAIHGDLTYSARVLPSPYSKEGNPETKPNMWYIGFDVCHYNDTLENWPLERCNEELDKLYEQAVEAYEEAPYPDPEYPTDDE